MTWETVTNRAKKRKSPSNHRKSEEEMKLAVISRKNGDVGASHNDISQVVRSFTESANKAGFTIFTDYETDKNYSIKSAVITDDATISRSCFAVVVFGGDGTMINAAKRFPNVALVGINMGRLGFVSDIPKTIDHSVILGVLKMAFQDSNVGWQDKIVGYTIGSRTMVKAMVWTGSGDTEYQRIDGIALNEITLSQGNGRIIEFEVFINGEKAYRCRGDGLIVSTPTGSTAYALSAGGAIIHPAARVFEIVPLVPQTLSCRPLIINDGAKVEVKLVKGEANISADGELFGKITSNDRVEISISLQKTTFLHPNIPEITYSYYGMLREKLNWQHIPGDK
jgi:NAD+ kinase